MDALGAGGRTRRSGLELRDGGQPLYPLIACAEGAAVLLTAENTAIVLDSTADLAGSRRAGTPTGRWCR